MTQLEKIEKRIDQLKKKLDDIDPSDKEYFYTLGVIDGLSAASKLIKEATKEATDGAHDKVYILYTNGAIQSLTKNTYEVTQRSSICGFYIDIDSVLRDAHAIENLNS